MELDFNKILQGQEQGSDKKKQIQAKEKKLTQTQTRARQQSCMISEVDKDLLPSNSGSNNNPTNFRVSLSDMLSIDKNDQSLETYKKNLLGTINEQNLKQDECAEVQIVKVEVICPDRPDGNITLDFKNKQKHFQIKEGCIYCLRIFFVVRFDIVHGLKFANNIYKMLIRVEKQQQKMGSFAPQQQPHYYDLPWVEAPSGFIARGDYKGKGLFLDNDGIVHCQFDYTFKIDKDW